MSSQDLPIYLIQSHGLYNIETKIDRKTGTIKIKENESNFSTSPSNVYIINNTPYNYLGLCTKRENNFFDFLNSYGGFRGAKNIILSSNPLLFQNILLHRTTVPDPGQYTPPNSEYLDKRHYFYDYQADERTISWYMGIIPFYKSEQYKTLELPKLTTQTQDEPQNVYKNRIFNNKIIHDPSIFGEGVEGKKNFDNYMKITNLINSSLPNPTTRPNLREGGLPIKMSEIVKILGEGIYISLSCSELQISAITESDTKETKKNKTSNVLEQLTIIKNQNLEKWKSLFSSGRPKTRNSKIRLNLAVGLDDEHPHPRDVEGKKWTTQEKYDLLHLIRSGKPYIITYTDGTSVPSEFLNRRTKDRTPSAIRTMASRLTHHHGGHIFRLSSKSKKYKKFRNSKTKYKKSKKRKRKRKRNYKYQMNI